jgi:hypothetical protein
MKKSRQTSQSLASDPNTTQDLKVGTEEPREASNMGNIFEAGRSEAHNPAWPTWPPRAKEHGAEQYVAEDWGHIFIHSPGIAGEPTDVRIEFDAGSPDARGRAFEFTQDLIAQVRTNQPFSRAEFIAADDHYHVLITQFDSLQHRIADGVYEAFAEGVLSGRRTGRSERPTSTFSGWFHGIHERGITRRR